MDTTIEVWEQNGILPIINILVYIHMCVCILYLRVTIIILASFSHSDKNT